MAVTKRSFKGQVEQRAYADPGSSTLDMIQNTTGAKAMQSSISKGGDGKVQGPGHDPDPPRRLQPGAGPLSTIPSGAELVPGQAQTVGLHHDREPKVFITGDLAPTGTGAGEGSEHLLTYAPVTQGSSTRVDRQQRRPGRLG